MIHLSNFASKLRFPTATLSVAIAGLVLVSAASAADLDFNVASGNFTTTGNWVNTTTAITVPAAAAPTYGDNAYVRNGGTVTINSDVGATDIRIGARRSITNPDYDNNGVVDAADYVLWRKGSTPLANDATPGSEGPEDYAFWRLRYGALTAENDIGGAGTLMWTAGEITGPTGFHTGGPSLRVGRHVNLSPTQLTEYDFPGIVTQNGATTKIMMIAPESKLSIGDGGSTPTPTNSYTLVNGTIGTAIGGAGLQGANTNDGINVINGYFTMLGGQIIDATPDDLRAGTLTTQRFMTIAAASAPVPFVPGTETYAKATFTGGTVDVLGGFRVAPGSNTRGYLTINGPVTITTGGDTSIGYNATNGVGQMDMSAGTLNVGRVYTDPVSGAVNSLIGRLQIGHRGRGTLNLSGGTINVTREIRVGTEYAAGGSAINQTGGTITTNALSIGIGGSDPIASGYLGASVTVDGPAASFTENGTGGSIIGNQGKGLFEIRQGYARLGGAGNSIQVSALATSEATINLKGGTLSLGGNVTRTNLTGVAPAINLTGGTLEFNNTVAAPNIAHSFQADLINVGSKLVAKPNALQQVTVGRRTGISPPLDPIPANFEMKGGSWDIDLGLNTVLGADWFNAANGTAKLTGGTLNINYLAGFTPNPNQVFRILRGGLGTTLGSVTIAGAGAGNWLLQEVPIVDPSWPLDEEIQLKYVGPGAGAGGGLGSAAVPEPSSVALVVFAAVGLLTARGKRSRTSV